MKRKITLSLLAITALGAAVIAGALSFNSVSAQTATPGDENAAVVTVNDTCKFLGKKGGGAHNEALANALGITTDELAAACTEAKEAALADAVKDGLITQAQADAIKSGEKPFLRKAAGSWLSKSGIDFQAYLADALGITVEKLQEAYAAAKTVLIDQAVTDGKLTQEQADLIKGRQALAEDETFLSSMKSAYQAAVAQALKSGVITQQQADQLLNNIPSFDGRGGGHGGRHAPKPGASDKWNTTP